ncbi:plasmid stabilization protein [Kaistia algarum]|uniref:type II toxin-antitoxin system RelE/ParE family toxin n=1 Tax=Kaistia algarum TaxID=2083279 RepID=UPI000CE74E43|nr:type II toxin-antitoxin system RelE/ParE family toxin [Kaistia algarum]MCX5514559.1 type II toxin-antitoxin system RelE/ParE family toxin [Kaistia algarum]PPE77573.1 plasmid stabilization protein [Kaistia algarum]
MVAIVISDRADSDLLDIWEFVASDSVSAADRSLDAIETRWLQLTENPLSGVVREDIGTGIRHLVAGS